jgi:hypothetical protein
MPEQNEVDVIENWMDYHDHCDRGFSITISAERQFYEGVLFEIVVLKIPHDQMFQYTRRGV